jgi:hypothetical protein
MTDLLGTPEGRSNLHAIITEPLPIGHGPIEERLNNIVDGLEDGGLGHLDTFFRIHIQTLDEAARIAEEDPTTVLATDADGTTSEHTTMDVLSNRLLVAGFESMGAHLEGRFDDVVPPWRRSLGSWRTADDPRSGVEDLAEAFGPHAGHDLFMALNRTRPTDAFEPTFVSMNGIFRLVGLRMAEASRDHLPPGQTPDSLADVFADSFVVPVRMAALEAHQEWVAAQPGRQAAIVAEVTARAVRYTDQLADTAKMLTAGR